MGEGFYGFLLPGWVGGRLDVKEMVRLRDGSLGFGTK